MEFNFPLQFCQSLTFLHEATAHILGLQQIIIKYQNFNLPILKHH